MTCFCHKLCSSAFADITDAEAAILSNAFAQAPSIFTRPQPLAIDQSVLSSASKRRRSNTGGRSAHPSRLPSQTEQQSQLEVRLQSNLQRKPRPSHSIEKSIEKPLETSIEKLQESYPHPARGVISQALQLIFDPSLPSENVVQIYEKFNSLPAAIPLATDFDIRIIIAIQRADVRIGAQKIWKRLHCYALAKSRHKKTSIDDIILRGQNVFAQVGGIKRQTIYEFLYVGYKWHAIVEIFHQVVGDTQCAPPTGLLCLLDQDTAWKKASPDECKLALTNLHSKTDIHAQAVAHSQLVERTVKFLNGPFSFVNSNPVQKPCLLVASTMNPSMSRAQYSTATNQTTSLHTAVPGRNLSEDSERLVFLLHSFDDCEISLDMLQRGVGHRKRWDEGGAANETDPASFGIQESLISLISNATRLQCSLRELESLTIITRPSEGSVVLSRANFDPLSRPALAELQHEMRRQALIIACRYVPWKYLETCSTDTTSCLRHILHALRQNHDVLLTLPQNIRVDIALSLLEASRWPGIANKVSLLEQVNYIMSGLNNPYVTYCIAQRQSLLHRIKGDTIRASSIIEELLPRNCSREKDSPPHRSAGNQERPVHVDSDAQGSTLHNHSNIDSRMHATIGSVVIQHAMNLFQNEKLAAAMHALGSWQPLHSSLAEEVVEFRMNLLRGRILRFQGHFEQSIACLERSAASQHGQVTFDEDLPDLICELADAYRELDDPVRGERLIRTQLERENALSGPAMSALKLSLAESLFAQDRLLESGDLCADVHRMEHLPKMGRLRLFITLAKLRHIQSDWDKAFEYWTQALLTLSKFPPTSGLATRTVHLSISDILRRQGQHSLEMTSREDVAVLGRLSESSEAKHWIAGLQRWLVFIESRDS